MSTNIKADGIIVERLPTLRAANALFLITMGLIITVGAAIQLWSIWIGLIGTELFLILLPALVYLRRAGLPARETLRLRWPGAPLAATTVLIGAGLFLMALGIDALMVGLLGYSTPTPPAMFPTTPASIVLCFVALAVFPPLCEEVLFRGLIQRAYERRSPIVGIVISGLLFAFWHLRFQGLLPIIPISFALGYVVWRSNSLISGILLHFTVNALAASYLIAASLRPDLLSIEPPVTTAAIGAGLAAAGLWWFHRASSATKLHEDPPNMPEAPPLPRPAWRFAVTAWPLFIAAAIYALAAGGEVLIGTHPEVLALGRSLQLTPGEFKEPSQWQYEVRNILDEPIGEATVRLAADDEAFVLERQLTVSAWNGKRNGSVYDIDETIQHQTTRWGLKSVRLRGAEIAAQCGEHNQTVSLTREGRNLTLSVSLDNEPSEEISLPDNTLLGGEWPWRLSGLPLNIAYAREVSFVSAGRIETKNAAGQHPTVTNYGFCSEPVVEETHLVVRGCEPVWTPAGNFIAWVVTVGENQTAWYDVEPPYTVVRYDIGYLSYLLTE